MNNEEHTIENSSNEQTIDKSIHDFDLNIIYEYFSNTERQGPGSSEETLKALKFISGLSGKSKIADTGYIAVTENTWFTEERPAEIQEFWDKIYPEIDTIPNKIAQMQQAGYLPIATYMLPESIWMDYYSQQTLRREAFLKKYKGNKTVEEFIASQQYEAELYYKYKAYYGYMFYIGKKI